MKSSRALVVVVVATVELTEAEPSEMHRKHDSPGTHGKHELELFDGC